MIDYFMAGLVMRCAYIAGEIEHTHERLRTLPAALKALDATFLHFDSDYRAGSI